MFPSCRSQRFRPARVSSVLVTMLVLTTLFALSTSHVLMDTLKHHKHRGLDDCDTDMVVSAVCYNCASMFPEKFHVIYSQCCGSDGPVRELCRDWYTEEPKRGRRDVWYY